MERVRRPPDRIIPPSLTGGRDVLDLTSLSDRTHRTLGGAELQQPLIGAAEGAD